MKRKRLFFLFFALIWLGLGWLLTSTIANKNQAFFSSKLQAQNALLALSVSNELNRIRVELPKIQGFSLFKQALIAPNPQLLFDTNATLKEQALVAKADAIFIVNNDGDIVARGVPFKDPFNTAADARTAIGTNVADKPYFQQASLEINAEYYETNNKMNSRMYHFASPIKSNDTVIGIIVLSYDLKSIYASLDDNSGNINFLVGLDGVIFASNSPAMSFQTISPFPEDLRKTIQQTRRYGSSALTPISSISRHAFFEESALKLTIDKTTSGYLMTNHAVSNSNWILFSALNSNALLTGLLMTVVFYLTFSSLVFLCWLYLRKRSEVQNKLADLNIELENRVEVLTSGLKKSNTELTELVSHYQTTQEKLEQTQYELLQSARLAALGELSATLNHELSQPALALRAYTENSLKLLERGDIDTVHQNFIEMRSICESMANIMTTIKNFSRQSSEKMRNTAVDQIIRQAMPIVKHLIEKSGALMHQPTCNLDVQIRCIPEQIEQVLVNLISNATDAVYRKPGGKIWLEIFAEDHSVNFIVRNNFSSVTPYELTKLFNPYYTTKKEGLGLGLVLCKRIIEAQDGLITARLTEPDEIEFIITLKQHKNQHE